MNTGEVEEGFVFPTSFGQQRLWFLHQWEPSTPVYNIARSFTLTGQLNIRALEHGFNELVRRHESLRTSFSLVDGQPVQVVAPHLTIPLRIENLSALPDSERQSAALRLATEEARRPFDLSHGPLLRTALLRLAEQEHILLLTVHHIVSDGWSMGILFRELSIFYEGYSTGKPTLLAELPVQYSDFAVWQRDWLAGEFLDEQLSYWRNQLSAAPNLLELPTDRFRPPVQTYSGRRQDLELSQDLTIKLKNLSLRAGVTLYVTLLAAFQTLLSKYTRRDDIMVGSPIAGRNRVEVEGLVGFFVNTLLLRTDLSADPTFRELLARVQKVALDAYAHQDLPFEKLVEELHPQRNLSHSPLFQVMFAFQNVPASELRLTGLTVTPFNAERDTATFDLSLVMFEEAQSLRGMIEYNTDLFDSATITRMIGQFETLLEGIVTDPDASISRLPLLSDPERKQLLIESNSQSADFTEDRCIHQVFEDQVKRNPEAIAVVCEGRQLSYRALNARANRVAQELSQLGVGPETLVGLCVERSLELVVGILAILKAGGAYVPLDPGYPKERLAFMLEDSKIQIVLTQERVLSCLPSHSARVVSLDLLDQNSEAEAPQAPSNPVTRTRPDNAAYVIYTSGSTGKPKGVVINHYNVVRLFQATASWFDFDDQDIWTLFHSYAFDFSVWEVWGALLYGGKLVVVPYWISRSPEMFHELLRTERVTVLNQTPSAFRQLIEADNSSSDSQDLALRLVLFGGEALDFQTLKSWFDRHGDRHPQLVNLYGITETTVHVTYRPIKAEDLLTSTASLIGAPIPDLELYVLDENHDLVPLGVPGEIYVGGAGLGRGYLRRPELTAERFIPNPFSQSAGNRLYRSGDLGRYLSDRDIEYRGRIDAQVKIRGYRIELGEVEGVLRQHAAVREAIVTLRAEKPEEQRLVAYVVPRDNVPNLSELSGFLKNKLPEYMVPSAFVFLNALPLTSNGKLDFRNLPDPDQNRAAQECSFIAPRTPVEESLAQIWIEVLNLERVGIRDNFFELGGHSLSLTKVSSRIRRDFGVSLPLRILFDAPTIADQGTAIAVALGQEDAAEAAEVLEEIKNLSPDEMAAFLRAERR